MFVKFVQGLRYQVCVLSFILRVKMEIAAGKAFEPLLNLAAQPLVFEKVLPLAVGLKAQALVAGVVRARVCDMH